MRNYLGLSIVSLSALTIGQAGAADTNQFPWRVGLNYRLGFHINASFRNAGLPSSWGTPESGPMGPSLNGRSYDDGYVGLDSSGNAASPFDPGRPLTSYWGYQNANQVQGGNVLMHYSEPGSLGRGSDDVDLLSHGLEITLARELGRGRNSRWGLEVAFGLSFLDGRWSGQADPAVLGADAYAMPAGIPPYYGFTPLDPATLGNQERSGQDPYLYTAPTPQNTTVAACLDATLYAFRVGPYAEFPLSEHFSLVLGGGLSIVVVDGEASFQESYSGLTRSAHAEHTGTLIGGYLSGQIVYKFNERWDIATGIQYHAFMGSWELRAGDKIAQVDLGSSFYWTIGIGYHF